MISSLELEYTEKEIYKIQQLRSRVEDKFTNKFQAENAFLLTWLRARNMNVDQAEVMLRKSLQWRKLNNVDGILEREKSMVDVFKRHFPFAYLGMEADSGCPVFLVLSGRYDFASVNEEHGPEYLLRLTIIFIELAQKQMKANAKKIGRPVTASILVLDLKEFSLRQVATRQLRNVIFEARKLLDENYPDSMKTMVLFNAPSVFVFFANMMKPLMPQATLEKVVIVGSDRVKWQEILSKWISMKLVPSFWGGTLPGNDEYCSLNDIWIGAMGPTFFSKVDEDGFIKTEVKPRDKFQIKFFVEDHDAHLEWKFRTEDCDIGFLITKDDHEVLVPLKRVESHKEVQEGRHKCQTPGLYKIIFDNTFSYTRKKILYHKAEVILNSISVNGIKND